MEAECLRTLDRLRLTENYAEDVIAAHREATFSPMEPIEVVEITYPIPSRTSQAFPTALGTLDAIHLSTALLRKERAGKVLPMATHDVTRAVAARQVDCPWLGPEKLMCSAGGGGLDAKASERTAQSVRRLERKHHDRLRDASPRERGPVRAGSARACES